uniref:Uncharacterized protein n=1 Tax=Anopheles farauti TaxID=69004 RepID=A0A9I3GJ76_9DIPT
MDTFSTLPVFWLRMNLFQHSCHRDLTTWNYVCTINEIKQFSKVF